MTIRNKEAATKLARALQNGADMSFEDIYDLKDELGKGAVATVYKALHKETGKAYAVKVSQKDSLTNCVDSIVGEIEIMCRIKHPNVIKIIQLFETEDRLYIVSELLSGGELFDHIAANSEGFTEQTASWLMKGLLQAIAYLHSMQVVHRDVKPENLLFVSTDKDSELRLVDFGIARQLGADELTLTMAGTPNYISPEVVMLAQGSTQGYGSSCIIATCLDCCACFSCHHDPAFHRPPSHHHCFAFSVFSVLCQVCASSRYLGCRGDHVLDGVRISSVCVGQCC